jgi:3-oxoadipate enol-lactonase
MKAHLAGIDVHYLVSGQGPWITLSHSLAAHSGMWDAQLAALESEFTVLRYDIRGHGQTQATEGPYELEQLASDACALLQHLGVERSHWIGLSLGGMIGQALAIRNPQVLDHVVIADSTSKAAPAAATMWSERAEIARVKGMASLVQPTLSRWFTEPYRTSHVDVIRRIGDMIVTTSVDGFAGCCAALGSIDTQQGLRGLHLPALVLVGDQDEATPPSMAQDIQRHWPNSKLKVLNDAAHLSNIEQPEQFNTALMEFLPH